MFHEITSAQNSNCSISRPGNMSETFPVIYGKKKWRRYVADVVKRLVAAIEPDEVVLGGGNVNKLKELPSGCRVGDNANAFVGGFRLWDKTAVGKNSAAANRRSKQPSLTRHKLRRAAKASVMKVISKSVPQTTSSG